MSANGGADKRKRGDLDERKPTAKERRLRQRQEEMEVEFAATYHGPTALYKLLEMRHLSSPLFLPRTLSYRLVGATAAAAVAAGPGPGSGPSEQKQLDAKASAKPAKASGVRVGASDASVGATLREFKIGMTADTVEAFKRDGTRVGLLFSLYTASGRKFADNSFDLIASCLIPVPCTKEARLPKQFTRPNAELSVVTVQVVRINDVIGKLMGEAHFTFSTPAASADVKPVLGAELLRSSVGGREPLFGNLLRIDGNRRRAGVMTMELPMIEANVRGVVKLQFRLAWEKQAKQSKMDRLEQIAASKWDANFLRTKDDVGAELSIPKSLKPSPYTRRGATHVWFHYLYHSLLRRMSEKRPDFSCAWCNMYAGSLHGLVSHLVSSHSRFRFHVSAGNDNAPHIYVIPRNVSGSSELTIPSVNPSLCELNLDDEKEADRVERHYVFISARKRGARSALDVDAKDSKLDRFHELEELDESVQDQPQEFYTPLLQRQYFHSRTGAVVLDHEKDYDSDDDVDEEWITQQSERLLDEFEDVSLEEKEFMKKWNRHVKENRILADFMVASSCRLFAKRHGKWVVDAGLRFNFLLHLFNLWDNSLLNSRAIIDCMLIVDHYHYAVLEETKAADEKDAAAKATATATTSANGSSNGNGDGVAKSATATSTPSSA